MNHVDAAQARPSFTVHDLSPGYLRQFFRPSQFLATRSPLFALMIMAVVIAVTGCSTTGKHLAWYDGPAKATNEVSLLKIQRSFPFGRSVLVWTIDGKSISKGRQFNNTREVELLPGTHTVGVVYVSGSTRPPTKSLPVTFTGQSGHTYALHMAPVEEGLGSNLKKATFGGAFFVTAWIIDESNGEVVAGERRSNSIKWHEP